jgi:hypothetical protein
MVPELARVETSVIESVMLDERYRGYIQRNLRRFRSWNDVSEVSLRSVGSYLEIEEIC